jgi:glutamate-1-semialdehyde 2,1-aminomutase
MEVTSHASAGSALVSRSRYERSKVLYERACQVLAGGVSSEFRKAGTPHPLFYERAAGARITDVDGNTYLDFALSQGPMILGHSHPEVLSAVAAASEKAQLVAGQHVLELELAESIQRLVPCAERIRFSLSGSEAVHAAVRVARATTGRTLFLRFEGNYHGWLDAMSYSVNGSPASELGSRSNPEKTAWTQGLTRSTEGDFLVLPYNDLELVEALFRDRGDEIAAVILEPVMCNNGCIAAQNAFLVGLRNLCDTHGTALIFDEVITGFRLALGGAQEVTGVVPDLAIFGKALASGYPISVVAGKEFWMRKIATGEAIHAGTMNSGHAPVAAAMATLTVMERDGVHARLYALGRQLMQGLRDAACNAGIRIRIQGPGPMFHLGFTSGGDAVEYRDLLNHDRARYAKFCRMLQEKGIRTIGRGLWYVCAAHTESDVEEACRVAAGVFAELAEEAISANATGIGS